MAWPVGTQVGDLAIAIGHDSKAKKNTNRVISSNGWKHHSKYGVWSKKVRDVDLTEPLQIRGETVFLITFAYASKVGKVTSQPGVRVDPPGGGALVFGRGKYSQGVLAPLLNKVGTDVITMQKGGKVRHNLWWIPGDPNGPAAYVRLAKGDSGQWYNSFEIVPPGKPNRAKLASPTSGAFITQTMGLTLSWSHMSSAGGEQEAAKLRIREIGALDWSYITSAGTLTNIETPMDQSKQSVDIGAGVFDADTTYEWEVSTFEVADWSDWSTPFQFISVLAPSVDSITATSVLNDLSPFVEWTTTAHTSGITAYRMRIYTAGGTLVWDSGVIPDDDVSLIVPARSDWANGGTYRASVKVQQYGGLWSPETFDDSLFTIAWAPPVAPTAVTGVDQPDAPVLLTVTGIIATAKTLEVQTLAGEAVVTVPLPAATQTLLVPQAVYGLPTVYRVRITDTIEGITVYSAWVSSAPITTTDKNCYLIDGVEYVKVNLYDRGDQSLSQGISIWYGIGAEKAMSDRGAVRGQEGSTTLLCKNEVDRAQVAAWLTTREYWILRWPPELDGPSTGEMVLTGTTPTRMTQATILSVDRVTRSLLAHRMLKFGWVEV